jgi:hypothetical protein
MRWTLLVAAGVLVAALAGGYWYLAQYRPLSISGMGTGDMRYEDGAEAFYGFGLHNDGRLPVRVTGINLESDRPPLLVRVEARIGFATDGDRADTRPFEAFTLGSGDSESITVFGRFDNCERYAEGTGTRRTVQLVRYRVLWIVPAEQEVELSFPLEIRSPPDARCPGR